ncbi:hypothetical protein HYW83_05940 [Candidatus Peregrinibacteria bacterium]|nr:hypothetical protein [Candidatus Peregrinibacteria bacterium]
MGAEMHGDNRINAEPEQQRESSGQKPKAGIDTAAGEHVVGGAMARLNSAPKLPETEPEQPPTLEKQLAVIMRLGKAAYDAAPSEKRAELWRAYITCTDKFREAYGGLPPFSEAWTSYKHQISSAMEHEDPVWLLRVFKKEKEDYARPRKFWEKVKRIPGVNFVAGIFGGAAELGSGVATLANEGRKSLGVFASEEEQRQAQQVMGAVGESLKHLDELAAGFLRSGEYAESIHQEGGATTGYVLGKHYFDVALMLIGGGVAKDAVKRTGEAAAASARSAAQKAIEAATDAAATAARVAEKPAVGEVLTAAGAVGIRTLIAEEAGAGTARQVVARAGELAAQGSRKAARAAGHAGKEVAKETPKEAAKEVAKHTPHAAEEVHGGTAHGGA